MSSIERPRDATRWWRSLDELADAPRFRALLEAEFPAEADPSGISRRRWLQLMGASLALAGASGCRWEKQEIRPFADRPEGRTPGKPRRFATAMPLGGAALGLEVTTVDGRPIKIEGNPRHPQSLGATDVLAQAAILELYDPDRSRGPVFRAGKEEGAEGTEKSWKECEESWRPVFERLREDGGAGLRVLAEASSSPTLDALRSELLDALPNARWFEYEPTGDDHDRAGTAAAFGRPLRTHWALDAARVIVCLDADPLGSHPAAVQHARQFAAGREPEAGPMNRLYAVESGFSVTGASADHRLPLRSSQIPAFVGMLERELRGGADRETAGKAPDRVRRFVRALADDLQTPENRGKSVVCIGPGQPQEAHAAVHRINGLLGNVGTAVHYTQCPQPDRPPYVEAIATLADELRAGKVHTLAILGGNPVYDAPADVEFGEALQSVPTSIHLSLYRNETSRQCTWHAPQAHFLESWGDVRSWDGTYSVIQPMIAPLFGGRSAIEVVASIRASVTGGEPSSKRPEEWVRQTFRGIAGDDVTWRRTLRDGLLAESRWPIEAVGEPGDPPEAVPDEVFEVGPENGRLEVVFCRDASVYDGRFANSSWLQEWPDPLTKLTWGNAALIGPATAATLKIENETWMVVKASGRSIRIPACIVPGVAPGSIGLALGYGRTAAGRVGGSARDGVPPVGVDVYPLRTRAAMAFADGVTVGPTGEPCRLATTQDHFAIDAVGRRGRDQRLGSLLGEEQPHDGHGPAEGGEHGEKPHAPRSLWREHEYAGHRWGMSIDLSRCIGCGACVVACQAENNIPVVGREQVLRGREMHWIRVDRYFRGDDVDDPEVAHQPVPCQQCELAPCEQVCPVAATTHSREGLNDMVYNRCVGTRYCANNCPFKVRRFNYFHLHKDLEDPANEVAKMKYNPQVTVRSRGVMEKCTYCVQRIQAARIEARDAGRAIRDGEIRTACQQVCPTGAIGFGDLADHQSEVLDRHEQDRAYTLLAELNVRPRTAYLTRVRNPNPDLA